MNTLPKSRPEEITCFPDLAVILYRRMRLGFGITHLFTFYFVVYRHIIRPPRNGITNTKLPTIYLYIKNRIKMIYVINIKSGKHGLSMIET